MNTQNEFKSWVEAHPDLVSRTESKTQPGLFVFKYKRRVFFDNLWTPELEYCRGLVLDADWNIVVQPFRKIYNRGERGTDFDLNDHVVYCRKVNGFMAAMTWLPDEDRLIVSTTGSLDSEFVGMAKEILFAEHSEEETKKFLREGVEKKPYPHMTFLFEIVHPNDPHIINEDVGAYHLAFTLPVSFEGAKPNVLAASHFYGHADAHMVHHLGYRSVSIEFALFSDVVERSKYCQHEGFVVYDQIWNPKHALKIKSPYYLVSKFFARKSQDKLGRILNDSNWPQYVDEEFYPLVHHLRDNKSDFLEMDEQERISFVRRWFVDAFNTTR